MSFRVVVGVTCLAMAVTARGSESRPVVDQVTVHVRTSWWGLGSPAQSQSQFDVACGMPACPFAVKLLLRCLAAPPKPVFDVDDFEGVVSWLEKAEPKDIQAVNGGAYDALYSVYASAPVRKYFEAARTDRDLIRDVLSKYYSPGNRWTDDYPDVSVAITLPNGERVTLSSRAQQEFMIPWHIERSGKRYATYEPNIGRALAALGPSDFSGRGRLAGTNLKSGLVSDFFQIAFKAKGPRP